MSLPAPVPHRPPVDPDWQDQAACRGDADPNRWVDLPPVRVRGVNNPAYDTRVAELAAVCATCPVFDHCLWAAVESDVKGVFAGTDEYDRADLRETLGLPEPEAYPPPENETDARLAEQRFAALRYARQNYSNAQIAKELGVSAMTVSRLLDQRESPRPRHRSARRTDTPLAS